MVSLRKQWIDIIYRVATQGSAARTILTPLGAGFFCLVIAFLIVASLRLDTWLGFSLFLPTAVHIILTPLLPATGLFLILWSNIHFMRVRGTPVPFNPPPKLVTTGPYAYMRNPMLTGVFLLLLGIGTLLRSLALTFIITPLFILLNVLELRAVEEPELEKRLGMAYVQYKKSIPMFIPRLWMRNRR